MLPKDCVGWLSCFHERLSTDTNLRHQPFFFLHPFDRYKGQSYVDTCSFWIRFSPILLHTVTPLFTRSRLDRRQKSCCIRPNPAINLNPWTLLHSHNPLLAPYRQTKIQRRTKSRLLELRELARGVRERRSDV